MTALLSCPFCGGLDIDPKGRMVKLPGGARKYGPLCIDCGASALDAAVWNRRAPVPGYAAGAEAMRERAAGVLDAEIASTTKYQAAFERMGNDEAVRARQIDIENYGRAAAAIRALPIPTTEVEK